MRWLQVFSLCAALVLVQCSDADTLADEAPVEVVINGMPSWQNGVSSLVTLKCGYCHAVPLPEIAPAHTPTDLDLNRYETTLVNGAVVRGADSIGRWIFDGILDQPVQFYEDTSNPRQMPLDYGTPLTAREKNSLTLWSDQGSPSGQPDPDLTGNFENGARLYFTEGCVSCHDNSGGGVGIGDGIIRGPDIRRASVTLAKIKSMWLERVKPEPLSDQDAADIRTYLLDVIPAQP